MASNIVNAYFGNRRETRTRPLYRYDYGQQLVFKGIELPAAYEVHFSLGESGDSTTSIGGADGVLIPNRLLEQSGDIYAWVYLHNEATDGETVYKAVIPVLPRPTIEDYEPSGDEKTAIAQALEALNNAVEQTAHDVEVTAGYAEDAQSAALEARSAASSAQQSAEAAEAAEATVAGHAEAAQAAMTAAQSAEVNAAHSAEEARGYAVEAETSADRAEQAAANAGYLDVEIDERGHLIYVRTDMVDVDFSLVNGHLIMEAV